MRFLLTPLLVLLLGTCARAQTQIGSDIIGETPDYGIGSSLALSADGARLIVATNNGFPDDFVRTYDLIADEWTVVGTDLTGRENGSGDHLRVSLSADGNRLAVGSPTRDDSPGQVELYNWTGTDWTAGTVLGGEADDDSFGFSLALSADGNTLVVGSPNYETTAGRNAGGVRVFRYGTFWEEITGNFVAGEENDLVGDGVQISADGNRIAYSRPGTNELTGAVEVFDYDGTAWNQVGQAITGTMAGDRLGFSLNMTSDGDRLAMGGIGSVSGGLYRVAVLTDGEWQTVGEEYRGEQALPLFGENIFLSDDGETLVLTNRISGSAPTGVYIETLIDGEWTTGPADFPDTQDDYGFTTVMAGNTLAFSSPSHQIDGEFVGLVRVYNIVELTPTQQAVIPLAKLWPNPTDDRLNVAGVTFSEGVIVDGFGRTVRQFSNAPISTLGLPAGAYFVRLRTEEGWATGRFLKR